MKYNLIKYKENWDETRERFKAWWNRSSIGRPMMRIVARRESPVEQLENIVEPDSMEELSLGVEYRIAVLRNFCRSHIMMAEAFPYLDLNIGPGSMATYLGAEPIFTCNTVWFKEYAGELASLKDLAYNGDNYWWKRHMELLQKAVELSKGEFLVTIPDILENIDILSAMRGPQTLCYDLADEPELVGKCIGRIDDLYFNYYDALYDTAKEEDGSSSYTAFSIWGPGRTAKVQCDFSALISPAQFREFIQPSLRKQCRRLDNSLYHLDGPDALKHLDALLEIDELDGIQWTPGAGRNDCGSEEWYWIYNKVRTADKCLWLSMTDGAYEDWVGKADKLVKRYGPDGLYLLFPDMGSDEALGLLKRAESYWQKAGCKI